MTRRQVMATLAIAAVSGWRPSAQRGPVAEVYKDKSCGCCALWVEHLRKAGFAAKVSDVADLNAIKQQHGVPVRVRSCHTARIGGYVVEGHVPIADVQRLLKERPRIAGIGVPGMPIGSPGMEVAGMKPQPYDVLAFDSSGATRVFASHR